MRLWSWVYLALPSTRKQAAKVIILALPDVCARSSPKGSALCTLTLFHFLAFLAYA